MKKLHQEKLFRLSGRSIYIQIIIVLTWLCIQPPEAEAQYITTVQDIATLRGLNPSSFSNVDNTIVYVIDYYSPPTGIGRGGGHFRWHASIPSGAVDDGGRYISYTANTSAGIWERLLNDGTVPNVKMWGAYGDGTHDDTIALQNSFQGTATWGNSASYHNTAELIVPAGTYMITNRLVIYGTQVHLRGDGPLYTTIEMTYGYSNDIIRTENADAWLNAGSPTSSDFDHGFIIENLSLIFQESTNGNRNTVNAGLVVCPGEESSIRNIFVGDGGVGIRSLGVGSPGICLRDVKTDSTIGVLIAAGPGQGDAYGGPVSILSLSGDQIHSDVASNASLVVLSNIYSEVIVSSIKAEGDWGGALIHVYTDANGTEQNQMIINNAYYNAGDEDGGTLVVPDFLKIDTSSTNYIGDAPVFSIEHVQLNGVPNLIRDNINGRIVESDTQIWSGYDQITANLPICYQPFILGDNPTNQTTGSSLMVGETAISTFYPTNTGWYRVMATYGDGVSAISGRLSITSQYQQESIEMQIDCSSGATPWINVVRSKAAGTELISQARAVRDDSVAGHEYCYVDVYVANTSGGGRLSVCLDSQEARSLGELRTELVSPILPVSATLPSATTVTTVNTYH